MKIENTLKEICRLSAVNTSNALSLLIDSQINMELARTRITKAEEAFTLLHREEIVAGIFMPITGDIEGSSLLVFPKESAFALSDLLVKREPGFTRKLNDLDISALKEVGNILSGNFLAVFSNKLGIKVIEHVPYFSFDMFGALSSQLATKSVQNEKKALVIDIELSFMSATCKGYFMLLFELEEFIKIQELLEKTNFEKPEK